MYNKMVKKKKPNKKMKIIQKKANIIYNIFTIL